MALIGDKLCIDRWENTVVDADGNPLSPYEPVDRKSKRTVAVSKPGVVPQGYISLHEATKACKAAGKRMCTTQEWLDACQGLARPKRTYPYGNVKRRGVCNDATAIHPVSLVFPGQRRHDSVTLNDPRLNRQPNTLAKTGAFAECVTPDGVHDMVGNLLEWTRGHRRPLLMGGHYVDSVVNGEGCRYVTPDHKEHYHDFTTGFRCCRDADQRALESRGPTTAPGDAPAAVPTGTGRDAPRSFHNPFGYLPEVSPPAYEAPDAACPVDMVLVEGQRCGLVEQVCKGYIDPPGMPQRACREYESPTPCNGAIRRMRFCIDRYEFTAPGEKLPLVNVSWTEAQNLCRKMDKRICFEQEWEFACEGTEALPYPYGFVRDGKRCNHDRDNLFIRGNELYDQRVPADALPRCRSPFGVFNIVGNVDEWTHRPSNEAPNRSILRGGWWLMGRSRCRAATASHSETYAGAQTGFRCCKPAR
ncbi:MAG: SUMF1/EgtB/PvdO family nonheme iron enzyme [Myxococcota bacterium]